MLGRFANGLAAVAGAAGLAQFPALYRQYLQNLAGRLAQARQDLDPVARDARERGLSIERYLERASAEGGELTGTLVQGYRQAFDSVQRLETAYAALRDAGPVTRPLAFLRHLDTGVLQGTLADYGPAVPVSAEGGVYALAGMTAGLGLLAALERVGRAAAGGVRRRRRHRQGNEPA